ncbi:unnamed protein product [Rotaria magnacalcarata]|uniref:Uncharacterized protein n=1 Tax=Rotaria magnacalcarata TaxID=392030 RepID=A0A819YEJ0_9BILA|nr:unnamed protein product [Rotaria magnacalcarata]CAF1495115.1 unnamed protein product [Rotaria magnacalcarata]CAF2107891.1 unnamed protein product [Rotaria magnacalcarata]CAF2247931.1 unnamed protein product [Rotaria magnacalcarata]CAF3837316.1 unnamed protein product [Rotaria magnacalcarata]
MTDDTCTFSYIAAKDSSPKIATGIERAWFDLKLEFKRRGEGLPGAKYYKTISVQGPQLFAVRMDQTVWYHDADIWHKYITARDIKYGKMQSSDLNPKPIIMPTAIIDDDDEPCFGEQDEAGS